MKKYILRKNIIGSVLNNQSGFDNDEIELIIDIEELPDVVSSSPNTFISKKLMEALIDSSMFNKGDFEKINHSVADESPISGKISNEFKKKSKSFSYYRVENYNEHLYIDKLSGKLIISEYFKNIVETLPNTSIYPIRVEEF